MCLLGSPSLVLSPLIPSFDPALFPTPPFRSEVTVVEYLDRIVPSMDTELATAFQRTMTKQGMKFALSTKVRHFVWLR